MEPGKANSQAATKSSFRRSVIRTDSGGDGKVKSERAPIPAKLEVANKPKIEFQLPIHSSKSKEYIIPNEGDTQSLSLVESTDKDPDDQKPRISRKVSKKTNLISRISYRINKSSFLKNSNGVKKYWAKLMKLYKPILKELEFPIFPEKAFDLNHISAQLWMTTFAMQDVAVDMAETVDIKALNDLYLNLVNEGEETAKLLDQFYNPLVKFSKEGGNYVKRMKNSAAILIDPLHAQAVEDHDDSGGESPITKFESQGSQKYSDILAVKKSLMCGNRILEEDIFGQMRIYMRTTAKRKWYGFLEIRRPQRMKIIKDSLEMIANSLVKIRKLLVPVLLILQKGKAGLLSKTCLTHMKNMDSCLRKMSKCEDLLIINEIEVMSELHKLEAYFHGIIEKGHQIVQQLYEVVCLTRISYMYVADELRVNFKYWGDVSENLKDPHNVAMDDLDYRDFRKAKYPDVLRKVPVVVKIYELSLQHIEVHDPKMRRRSVAGDAYLSNK